MNKKLALITLIAFLSAGISGLKAQKKYFVKFTDKIGTPYTVGNPGAFLGWQSVARRANFSIAVNSTDLPVTPKYVTLVAGVPNVTILYAIKWLNGVVVSIPDNSTVTALPAINSFSFVASSNITNKYKLDKPGVISAGSGTVVSALRAENTASFNMGGSSWQNKQIEVDCLHQMGYRGQGMVIAVLDAGFFNVNNNPVFDSLRARNGIKGTHDFVTGGSSVYEDADHGAAVLSCMAAIKPGVIMGSAPMADYWLLRTEDASSENLIEEYNWVRGAEFADSVGADILTSSLGYNVFDNTLLSHPYSALNGRTAPMSIASTMAVRKGMFVLTAAGNGGPGYISVAGDADSVCTVGAIDSLFNVASFSSVGPTYDGRIKPDLCARGVAAWVSDGYGNCLGGSGTSFATPILAGGVACCWQRQRTITAIQLLNILKSTATHADSANNSRGWGTARLCTPVVGFAENKLTGQNLSIYPNPFNSSIQINAEGISNLRSIDIMDVLGHVLKQINTDASTSTITLSTNDLSDGIYFIRVNTATGAVTKKIIKQ